MSSDAQKEAFKRYNKKKKNFALSYAPTDIKEGLRLEAYIKENGLSCNAYLKELVKRDLDAKGVPYPQENNELE